MPFCCASLYEDEEKMMELVLALALALELGDFNEMMELVMATVTASK